MVSARTPCSSTSSRAVWRMRSRLSGGRVVAIDRSYAVRYILHRKLTAYEARKGEGEMKALTRKAFGPPETLELREVDRPEPEDDEVLVRVRAASLNRYDWYNLTGTPWVGRPMTGLRGPKSPLIGADFAGTIETVGAEVTGLQPGDEVYGLRDGALAEYVQAKAGVALKPANLSFEEAAAVPMAGLTALQGARKAEVK